MKKRNPYKKRNLCIVNDSYRTQKQLMLEATISACVGVVFGIVSCVVGYSIYYYFFGG